MHTQTYEKSIQYDRSTRDYRMKLNDRLIGFASTYHEAEVHLDELVYALLSSDPPAPPPPPEPEDNPDKDNTPTEVGPSPL